MPTERKYDNNGFFEIEKNPISKVGIFPYLGSSIGAPEPEKIYMVYRPAEELSNSETIESFKLQPFVDDHTMLGDGETPAEQKGVQGTLGEKVIFENDTLFSNIKVWSDAIKNLIKGGKKELSCGYRCTYEFIEGVFNGNKYDAIQRNIRGNHIALVDEGRMGKEVRVLDHLKITFDAKDLKGKEMDFKELLKELNSAMDEKLKPINSSISALDEEVKEVSGSMKKMSKDTEEKEKEDGKDKEDSYEKMKDEYENMKKELEEYKSKMDEMKSKEKGMDEAIKIAKDQAIENYKAKEDLAVTLSKYVGSFDHSEMSHDDVVKYGCDKLELETKEGFESATLNAFLAGMSKVQGSEIVSKSQDSQETGVLKSLEMFKKGA